MVLTFDRENEVWRDENGQFASPPPDALPLNFDSQSERWRYEEGHPQAGQFAPSPEPDEVAWSFTDPQGRRIDTESGEIVSSQSVASFKSSLKRKGLAESTIEKKVQDRYDKLYKNPKTGDLESKSEMRRRNRNLERAEMFKGFADASEDLTYQDFQQFFKGVSTKDIRGKFEGIDEETGEPQYGPPTDEAKEIFEFIIEEHGIALEQTRLNFIETP